jgi:hypothetical protein
LGIAVRIIPIHYIITKGTLGNSSKRHYCISSQEEQLQTMVRKNPIHYIITKGAVGNSGKNKPNTLYHHKQFLAMVVVLLGGGGVQNEWWSSSVLLYKASKEGCRV